MNKVNYAGRLTESTYKVGTHTHDSWELVYYTAGSGTVEIADGVWSFKARDVFLIPPGVPHSDYADGGFQNYHYNFNDNDFVRGSFLKFTDTEPDEFFPLVELLYREYHLKRQNYHNIIDGLHDVIMQYAVSASASREDPGNPYVARIINDIINNISNPHYRVSSAFDDIPFAPDYFRQVFQKTTGYSPLQYLTFKRISYAKQLLRLNYPGSMSIQEIGRRSGFVDSYYFSRIFKKETGLSPKDWARSEAG